MKRVKQVLIAEDSDVVALLLQAIIDHEDGMKVVGRARDGREAVRMTAALHPDLVTMDIRMPVMDGFDATRQIMARHPTPVIVVSANVNDDDLRIAFHAIEAGALAVIEKPPGVGHPDFEAIRRQLVDTIGAMAGLRLVARTTPTAAPQPTDEHPAATAPPGPLPELLAIGASTGGPQALHLILTGLPADLPVPVLVVQHIAPGFLDGLGRWLSELCPLPVTAAVDGQPLRPGYVYLAPDDHHLTVQRTRGQLIARLDREPPVNWVRPSATRLFESVARACPGAAVGVLLTGMGSDGAEGLLAMNGEWCHTVVQDEQSAIVYGMPQAALRLGAVDRVVPLGEMAAYLTAALASAGRVRSTG